jgi:hypothetical protein
VTYQLGTGRSITFFYSAGEQTSLISRMNKSADMNKCLKFKIFFEFQNSKIYIQQQLSPCDTYLQLEH